MTDPFDPTAGGMEVARITIRKTVTDEDVIVTVDAENENGDELAVIDAVGMLTFAIDTILHPPADDL